MKTATLLLRPRSLFGANIVNLPAIYTVKKHLNAEKITVLTDINLSSFYKQISWVDHQSEAQSFYKIFNEIERNSDLIYSMRPSMDGAPFFKYLKNIKYSIGLSLRSSLLNRMFDYHTPNCESTYRAISHLQPIIDFFKLPQQPAYYLRKSMLDIVGINNFTHKNETNNKSICFMPGAGSGERKKWGIENYWLLAKKLYEYNDDIQFDFLIGTPEKREHEYLIERQNELPITIHKDLSLRDLVILAENTDLTVANDCGPSHISQCLVKPFVGLYVHHNPEWHHSYDLSREINNNNKNIKDISVNKVFDTCINLVSLCKN